MRGTHRRSLRIRVAAGWVLAGAALLAAAGAEAQGRGGDYTLSYSSGLNVSPAYEGWERDPDGRRYFLFGYMNHNWEEEIVAPVGADNAIEPGGPDQGQPTRFLPRRNRFIFRVPVPDGFGETDEMVWTLTTNGVTEKAYATLRLDYFVDSMVRASEQGAIGAGTTNPVIRSNTGPTLTIEGAAERQVRVGEPLTLVARATDDGLPESRRRGASRRRSDRMNPWRPPYRGTVSSETGLRVSWFVYRGAGDVTVDPPQVSVWEDTRPGAHSPWAPLWVTPEAPPDNGWVSSVTFHEPGVYTLRCRASDGALDVDRDILVTVVP